MGGFPTIRHNEVMDITATLLSEVCHNVSIEPHLQPLSGEIITQPTMKTMQGWMLWVLGGKFEKAFFDVRVFNPSARSNNQSSLQCT